MALAEPLILLVGMHRSGTSLAASLVDALGVVLPGPWPGADRHNPAGYFEWLAIRDLQEQLLVELDRPWPSAAGLLPLPADWLEQPTTRRAADRLESLLRQEISRHQGPWAIKDPRSSLLLPLWRRVVDRLGLELRLVESVREPGAVMLSLLERDAAPAGMTPRRALQLWWEHHRRIQQDGEGLARFTLCYERWFTAAARGQLEALACFCLPQPPAAANLEAAHARIRPEHRHQESGHPSLPLAVPPPMRTLYQQLAAGGPAAAGITAPPERAESWAPEEDDLCLHSMPEHLCLGVVGGSAQRDWAPHAWLNRCPLPARVRFSTEVTAVRVQLHLQSLAMSRAQGLIDHLRSQAIVLDPNPRQVQALREAGVNAFWIDPQAPASGWLESYGNASRWAERLGLPDPAALARHGRLLCLGSLGLQEDRNLKPPIWGLPGFDRLRVGDADGARLLASWLNRCNQLGLQLVRLNPAAVECHGEVFRALNRPQGERHETWLPAPLLEAPMTLAGVEEELAWRRAGCPRGAEAAPQPTSTVVWQSPAAGATAPEVMASVCVTLYNYGACVEEALESVRHQTLRPLELIVVDDASEDDGGERVHRWLERHGRSLGRAVLLRHRVNGGLAAARNTAFRASSAPWCLVLDADNALEPEALHLCLQVAQACPASTAVVHPLIELRNPNDPPGEPEPPPLLDGSVWQAEALKDGNKVDAMALVRRESWQQVGGYVPSGGWEDYDLWCRFVEAGLHGVICPQRLAIYNRHPDSMNQSLSIQARHQVKRLLQQRHHWLRLLPQSS